MRMGAMQENGIIRYPESFANTMLDLRNSVAAPPQQIRRYQHGLFFCCIYKDKNTSI
ncbi:hypothetical protein D3C84_1258540 [compost metagenome]